MARLFLLTILIFMLGCLIAQADNSGRIYGKIFTTDGDELEGLIRWDKNEGSWVDILNGNKERHRSRSDRDRDRRRSSRNHRHSQVKIFGLTLGSHGNADFWGGSRESGIRFGHIKVLEPTGEDEALLTLKSGEKVEFVGGSTDIGEGIREIIIEDEREGELELVWDDIDRIEFMAAPNNEESNFGKRLYGTMTTRRGETFTGFVCWDTDELFERDVIDGDERSRSRRVKFGKVKAIERYSSSGATLFLKSGDEMTLKGTNDVNSGNRGIAILDPNLGMIEVEWDEFDRLDFTELPKGAAYSSFDGGRRLYGTVLDEDGTKFTGEITWDDDEEYSWEILNGSYRGVEFDVEFGMIKSIERQSSRGSIVTLKDGRVLKMRDSNDVDDDNNGIIITLDDGEVVELDWYEFDRVDFKVN